MNGGQGWLLVQNCQVVCEDAKAFGAFHVPVQIVRERLLEWLELDGRGVWVRSQLHARAIALTRTEGTSCTCDDHNADVVIGIDTVAGIQQFRLHFTIVCVHGFRPVQGDGGNAVFDIVEDCVVVHG